MGSEVPWEAKKAEVPVAILVDKKDPTLCWSDFSPQGKSERCRFLNYHRRRGGLGFVQWCSLFPGSEVKRIDQPIDPKFKRCAKCVAAFK
jgi:hypothetical protein